MHYDDTVSAEMMAILLLLSYLEDVSSSNVLEIFIPVVLCEILRTYRLGEESKHLLSVYHFPFHI